MEFSSDVELYERVLVLECLPLTPGSAICKLCGSASKRFDFCICFLTGKKVIIIVLPS